MVQLDPNRDAVEMLAEDFAYRLRQGENPTVEDYVQRYPDLASEISDLFPFVAVMEEASSQVGAGDLTKSQLASIAKSFERLDDYRIIRQIGRGGMGVVFEAEQESLARHVAVKVLADRLVSSASQIERFHREAQAAAKLHHTNIVPVFSVGECEGLQYYVMQLIQGDGLDVILQRWRQQREKGGGGSPSNHWKAISRIGIQLATAVSYAHGQHILHRDLKPSNVIIGEDGTPWITDFGLAKLTQAEDLTNSHDLPGTLRYMAPEQFDGDSSTASDIYSLGITLYEAAVLQPAFDQSSHGYVLDQIRKVGPTRPRNIAPTMPRDLETILVKATATSPTDRYQSASEMADDLSRFIEDRPIRARRITWPERTWRWSRRNPALAAATAVSSLLLVLVAFVATIGSIRTSSALERVDIESRRAEANLALAIDSMESIIDKVSARGVPPTMQLEVDDVDDVDSTLHDVELTTADADLLEDLLTFFDQLATNNGPELQTRTAEAQRRVGDIRQRLGQLDEAVGAYRLALQIYERLSDSQSATSYIVERSQIHREIGGLFKNMGQRHDARNEYETVVNLINGQPADIIGEPQSRLELTNAYLALATKCIPTGITGPDAITLSEDNDHRTRRDSPSSRTERSNESEKEDHRKTRVSQSNYVQLAKEQVQQLLEQEPDHPDYQFALANCYRAEVAVQCRNQQVEEAQQSLQQAISILQQLSLRFSDQAEYQLELVDALLNKSIGDARLDSNVAYRDRAQRAVCLADKLAANFPHVHEYRGVHAASLRKLGSIHHQLGEFELASFQYTRSMQMFTNLIAEFPNMAVYQIAKAQSGSRLGELYRDSGDFDTSREILESTIADLAAAEQDHQSRLHRLTLGSLYSELAKTMQENGDSEEAVRLKEMGRKVSRSRRNGRQQKEEVLLQENGAQLNNRKGAESDDQL